MEAATRATFRTASARGMMLTAMTGKSRASAGPSEVLPAAFTGSVIAVVFNLGYAYPRGYAKTS